MPNPTVCACLRPDESESICGICGLRRIGDDLSLDDLLDLTLALTRAFDMSAGFDDRSPSRTRRYRGRKRPDRGGRKVT